MIFPAWSRWRRPDNSDVIAYFSNYGAHSVQLSAPGVNVLSTYWVQGQSDQYATMSGTSMATPFVSGRRGAHEISKSINELLADSQSLAAIDGLRRQLGSLRLDFGTLECLEISTGGDEYRRRFDETEFLVVGVSW